MKTTIEINGQAVEITLTPDQVDKIKKASAKITDRVRSFADVLEILCISEEEFQKSIAFMEPDEVGYRKTKLLYKVLNEGWTPDWSDGDQPKYFPWMKYTPGSGFSYSASDCANADSRVGSRLVLKSRELAEFVGRQFPDIINEFWL